MFDRIEKHQHSHFNSCGDKKVTITENRAPTEESIRLSEEIRDKILNSIIYREKPDNNAFDYRFYILDEGGFCFKAKMVALINGIQYEATENIYNLKPQEKTLYFDQYGNKYYRNKYSYEQITFLRKEMLTKLLVQSMLDTNYEEFHKFDQRFAETIGDNWSFRERFKI